MFPMITTIAQKSRVAIPAEVVRRFGIRPGFRLDWRALEGTEQILVRVIPDRREPARRLLGAGRRFSPERDAVAELAAEREANACADGPGAASPPVLAP
jgi:bifunctional DNA-binding transcriptional regulator/antitoxin component of YhaV-PrlF toxin-antitoxin module